MHIESIHHQVSEENSGSVGTLRTNAYRLSKIPTSFPLIFILLEWDSGPHTYDNAKYGGHDEELSANDSRYASMFEVSLVLPNLSRRIESRGSYSGLLGPSLDSVISKASEQSCRLKECSVKPHFELIDPVGDVRCTATIMCWHPRRVILNILNLVAA
jgi:hypothetical protein